MKKLRNEEFLEEAQKIVAEQVEKAQSEQPVKQVNIYDKRTGRLLSTSTKMVGKSFGIGWCMCKKDVMRQAALTLSGSTLRVLMYLYSKQTYGEYVMVGVNHIARELQTGGWRIGEALKALEEGRYIKKVIIDGNRGFLLNPEMTACGRSAVYQRRALWQIAENLQKVTTTTPMLTTIPLNEKYDAPTKSGIAKPGTKVVVDNGV